MVFWSGKGKTEGPGGSLTFYSGRFTMDEEALWGIRRKQASSLTGYDRCNGFSQLELLIIGPLPSEAISFRLQL